MRAVGPIGIVGGIALAGAIGLVLGGAEEEASSVDGVAVVRVAPLPPALQPSTVAAGAASGADGGGADWADSNGRRDMAIVRSLDSQSTPEQAVLADAMASQNRDAAAAGPVESGMQTALAHVATLTGASGPPRVTCVDTTCEVTGIAAAGQSPSMVEQALREPMLVNAMLERGYMPGPITTAGGAEGTRFVMYLNDEM